MAVPLAEAHSGSVSALATHPSREGAVLSCGADGTLRLWDLAAAGGPRCEARRTFSSAQTVVATCPARELIAVGSETGVLRCVTGGPPHPPHPYTPPYIPLSECLDSANS